MNISDQIKAFLAAAWEKDPDQTRYAAAVATKFTEFVAFAETAFRSLAGRLKVLEDRVAALSPETAPAVAPAAAPSTETTNGHAVTGAGVAPHAPPAATKPVDTRNMVRLGADNEPLSPEEQAVEEKMDLAMNGKIDDTRYVPQARV